MWTIVAYRQSAAKAHAQAEHGKCRCRPSGSDSSVRHPCVGSRRLLSYGRDARPCGRVVSEARGRLPRRALGAVARRPPPADRGHRGRADPVRRHHVLRGERHRAGAAGGVRIGRGRREGPRRRPVSLRRRDHRLGGRAPRARAREPRRARPARPLRHEHDARSGVADRRPARRPRPAEGHAQHLPLRLPGVHGGRVPAGRPLRRCRGARDRQRAHSRDARAAGADRPADRPLEPPRLPRAAPGRARLGLDRADVGRADHGSTSTTSSA